MQIGDTVHREFRRALRENPNKELIPGTIVYIHPKRRFYIVEFEFRFGRRCRESFYFEGAATPGKDTNKCGKYPSST